MPVSLTVRERIIEKLITILSGGVDQDGAMLFRHVRRGNLDSLGEDATILPAAGVEEGPQERVAYLNKFVDQQLRVYVHFKFRPAGDVDPEVKFNYYLGQLERLLLADITLGKLSYNVLDVGSAPEIDYNDPTPGGVYMIDILYRYVRGDPYTGAHENA